MKEDTNISVTGVDLVNGKEYVAIVRATNMAGLCSKAKSDGFIYDKTKPITGEVSVELKEMENNFTARWKNFKDVESGILRYEVCLTKSSPDNCSDNDFQFMGVNASYSFTLDDITYPGMHFVAVKAVNNAGLESVHVSRAFGIDTSAPVPEDNCSLEQDNPCVESSLKLSHTSNELRICCFEDFITASWQRYHDKQSGISKVEWCVGSLNTTCDIRNWESISMSLLSLSSIIPSLANYSEVYMKIRFTNKFRQARMLKSKPCVPLKIHPPIVGVREIKSLNATDDIDFQRDLTTVAVTWDANFDVSTHQVQVALTDASMNIAKSLKFVDVSSEKNQVIFVNLTLRSFAKYHSVLRLWNEFGLYSDSYSNGVITVPDHPFLIDVDIRQKSFSYDNKWKQYFNNNNFFIENENHKITYLSHPLNMLLNLSGTANIPNDIITVTETERTFQEAPCLFKLSIERITAEYDKLENTTTASHTIFDQTHVYNIDHTCCSDKNSFPRTIFPDRELKSVTKLTYFGCSVAALSNSLVAVVSQGGVHLFPAKGHENTLRSLPLHFMEFDHGDDFSSIILKGTHDQLLISANGNVFLYDIVSKSSNKSVLEVVINHCTTIKAGEESSCSRAESWSSQKAVGKSVAYDFNKAIAVGGFDNKQSSGVVAIFEKQNTWNMRQTLRVEPNDSLFGRCITINKDFLVVLGGETYPITLYRKIKSNNLWSEDKNISEGLKETNSNATNVYLTDENELLVISSENRYLHVFQLNPNSSLIELNCRHSFSEDVDLSGSLEITRTKPMVIAVGCRVGDSDGATLLSYGPETICHEIGKVIMKPEFRFDRTTARASVALLGDQVIVGIPELPSWQEHGQNSGTGRVFLATFCSSNSVRSKRLKFGRTYVTCDNCKEGAKAYPGFEEQCVNCTNVFCANQTYMEFGMDEFDISLSRNNEIRAVQNISSNNLTVMETTAISDNFYQADTKQSYFVRLSQVSAAGFESTRESSPIWFDKTSPEPGQVYDGFSSSQNCSGNITLGSTHQYSSRDFSETDIDFTSNTTTIKARWVGFRDNESSIESYHWCIGSNPLSDDIMRCANATDRVNDSFSGLSLSHGNMYYVTVVACNHVKLCTARSSDGVLVDLTPPILDSVNDGIFGEDIDMQVLTNLLFGNWEAHDNESGIASYEVAWGTSPGLDDIWEFQEVGNFTTWFASLEDHALQEGQTYYLSVRAINGAGMESNLVSSDGIVIGKTEFVLSQNQSGYFFFDIAEIYSNGSREASTIKSTFGTLKIPEGAVENKTRFRCFRVKDIDDKLVNTAIVDPGIVRPSKHFKLGNYTFVIESVGVVNESLGRDFKFSKPVILTIFYDVEELITENSKTVNKDVTKEDIDPVILLWDTKNKTWFDASRTCPEPWSYVDRSAKLIKVQVCHLTQFALFWTFEDEHGIIEFERKTHENLQHNAIYDQNDIVVYDQLKDQNRITLDLTRRKGSNGNVTVQWAVNIQSGNPDSVQIKPMVGKEVFLESQWNSSINIEIFLLSEGTNELIVNVSLVNVTGGATLGNFTSLKITNFSPHSDPEPSTNRTIVYILISLAGTLIVLTLVIIVCYRKRGRTNNRPAHRDYSLCDIPTNNYDNDQISSTGV